MLNKQEYVLNNTAKTCVAVAIIVAIGLLTFLNSLFGQFIWDDNALIVSNTMIQKWSNIGKVFTSSLDGRENSVYPYYRPLFVVSLMVDYRLWGLDPFGYHLSTVLIHLFCGLAMFWLVNMLYQDRLLSCIAGILFVVHPVHCEDVAYITGRANSLAIGFLLISFVMYVRFLATKRYSYLIAFLICYVVSLLSKEIAITLPVLLLLYHFTFKKRLRFGLFSVLSALPVIYLITRCVIVSNGEQFFSAGIVSMFLRIPGFFVALTKYIVALVLPFHLHMAHMNMVFPFHHFLAIIGYGIAIFFLWFAVRIRRRNNIVFFSILWFFISLLTVSNIFHPGTSYMAYRYLYLASVGFCLIAAYFLSMLYRSKVQKPVSIMFIGCVVMCYASLSMNYNTYWSDAITFYEKNLEYVPNNFVMNYNLANTYRRIGRVEKAIPLYVRAISEDPYNISIYYNLGLAFRSVGNLKESERVFQLAANIGPSEPYGYFGLALLSQDAGRTRDAIAFYNKVIELDPNHVAAYSRLIKIYPTIGELDKAAEVYHRLVAIQPDKARAFPELQK